MEKTQWYIGTPNGVVVCVDEVREGKPAGEFYQGYRTGATAFVNTEQLLFELDQFYDSIDYPRETLSSRSFDPQKGAGRPMGERRRIMSDKELLSRHGDLGTFIIRVQHRQNSSWQGRITWMEKNQTICFRSVWEMIKLIASAIQTVSPMEEEEEEQSWAAAEGE